MSCKGFRYEYAMSSHDPLEYLETVLAYTRAGWVEVTVCPSSGVPTHIVFEWPFDRPPIYPHVDWPRT